MAKRKSVADKNKELAPLGKQVVHYGIVLCVKPNEYQKILFNKTFGCSRLIYNDYLSNRQEYYNAEGKTLSVANYKKNILTPKKKTKEFSFLQEVDKFALEVACENVQDAYDRFFKRQNKYPKRKTKRKAKKTYTTKMTNNNICIEGKTIKIPKAGNVPFIMPKTNGNENKLLKVINGKSRILNATISLQGGKYYISLCCEEQVDLINKINIENIDLNKVTGVDLGIKDFATMTNGKKLEKISNPKYLSKSEKKLAKLQKKLSKKDLDSSNYKKAKMKVARLHKKISNQRLDHAHKLSRRLTNENQVVILEDLNIKGMVKNKKLSKAISDAGWSKFMTLLKYKLEREGKYYIEIDRWFASSKICSHCGEKHIMLTLDERSWTCSSCGINLDRDENASKNIREEGIRLLLNNLVVT